MDSSVVGVGFSDYSYILKEMEKSKNICRQMHAGIVFSIHSLIQDCSLLARVLKPIGVVDRIFQTLVSKNSKTEP